MRSIRILLTCVGGHFGLDTIKALRQEKKAAIRITGVDANDNIIARDFVDSFFRVPYGSDRGYIPEISRICQKEKIDIIIPTADEEVLALSKTKKLFSEKGVVCAADDFQRVDLVLDKFRLYNFLRDNGIKTPDFRLVSDIEDIKKSAVHFDYPKSRFVLKPRRSRGARNIFIVGSDKGAISLGAVCAYFKKHGMGRSNYIATEFVQGHAYDVDVLAKDGDPICVVPRRRVWRNNLSPYSEGCVVEDNPGLIKFVTSISKLLKINYAYDFDCGTFRDSTPAIYEINPRLSGSVAAGVGAGVNIPVMLIRMMKGMKTPKPVIKFGVTMVPVSYMTFFDNGRIQRF